MKIFNAILISASVFSLCAIIHASRKRKPSYGFDPSIIKKDRIKSRIVAVKLPNSPSPIYPPQEYDLLDSIIAKISIPGEPTEVYQSSVDKPLYYYLFVPTFISQKGSVPDSWYAVKVSEIEDD